MDLFKKYLIPIILKVYHKERPYNTINSDDLTDAVINYNLMIKSDSTLTKTYHEKY
jgi:hypothetical protein